MALYGVAVVKKPTIKEMQEGTGQEVLVYGPKWITAKDPQSAAVAVVAAEDFPRAQVDMSRCEVQVSPFA